MSTDRAPGQARQREGPNRPRTPGGQSTLPGWMLDPPPPRRTLGLRIRERAAGALPGAGWLRRRWWAWQRRERLHQRYPNTVKVAAMILAWVVALLLVMFVYALFDMD